MKDAEDLAASRAAMSKIVETGTAARFIPDHPTLASLTTAAARCTACPLWKTGTQTVFGEGPVRAVGMFIGEQPGDAEDRAGRPFVGPAGQLFDEALGDAGLDRDQAYVTNTVKHFKWTARGKRRIHEKPNRAEVDACSPWLFAEIAVVKPRVIVCLGATAAQTLIGKQFRVTKQRGQPLPSSFAAHVLATVHPSSILRAPDDARQAQYDRFVADLRVVNRLLAEQRKAS